MRLEKMHRALSPLCAYATFVDYIFNTQWQSTMNLSITLNCSCEIQVVLKEVNNIHEY